MRHHLDWRWFVVADVVVILFVVLLNEYLTHRSQP